MQYEIHRGDCIATMRAMPDNSVDSIVTDPPYELGFMGKTWDASGIAYSVDMWTEALRVLKPGGHLLAFSGSRTYHRMTCAIEDAGFEVRDQIMWVYGSGFPKSLDVSKAIDKAAGAEREVIGSRVKSGDIKGGSLHSGAETAGEGHKTVVEYTAPATDDARQWEGWGTALKPAHEPICVARKPFKGNVAANVLAHGTGALNIDGCRVEYEADCRLLKGGSYGGNRSGAAGNSIFGTGGGDVSYDSGPPAGRWPANLIHDGSDEVLAGFPEVKSGAVKAGTVAGNSGISVTGHGGYEMAEIKASIGSAARFFYCAKASKADRGPGNTHPTVKPQALMRYLVRLVTPPGGHVLDPFAGSGSTVVAALSEGMRATGIELLDDHADICENRADTLLYGDLL